MEKYIEPGAVTRKDVVHWAAKGDELSLEIVNKSGEYLGKGLSILIDILNPELIVIGSIGVRLGDLLFEPANKVIRNEALKGAAGICEIVPAELGEKTGDFAALYVALKGAGKLN